MTHPVKIADSTHASRGLSVIAELLVKAVVAYVLTTEYNNANLLLHLLTALLGTSILLHITNITCPTTWRRVLGKHR